MSYYKQNNKDHRLLVKILFTTILTIITIIYGLKPDYNWDMLAYMAAVLRIEDSNSARIHSKVYEITKSEVSKEDYHRLTNLRAPDYRKKIELSEDAFTEQIPFYSIKISYVYLIYLFYNSGFSLTFATVIPSLLSVFLIGILLFNVFIGVMRIELAALFSIIIIMLGPMANLARYSTPDAFSALLLLSVSILFLKKSYLLIPVMLFAITVRPDNIIFFSFLLMADLLGKKLEKPTILRSLISLSALFIFYFLINSIYDNLGYRTLFYHSFIEWLNYPISSPPVLDLQMYFSALYNNLNFKMFIFLCILFLPIIINLLKVNTKLDIRSYKPTDEMKIYIVILITYIVRILLFPVISGRFYFVYILIIITTAVYNNNTLALNLQKLKWS